MSKIDTSPGIKKRTCGKCPDYSYSLRRCRLGYVNPRTLKATLEAMNFYFTVGASFHTICWRNKWKEKAIKKFLGIKEKEAQRKTQRKTQRKEAQI